MIAVALIFEVPVHFQEKVPITLALLVPFLQSSDNFAFFAFTLLAILLPFYQYVSTFCLQTNFFRYTAASSNVNLGKNSVSIKEIALLQISLSSNHYHSLSLHSFGFLQSLELGSFPFQNALNNIYYGLV